MGAAAKAVGTGGSVGYETARAHHGSVGSRDGGLLQLAHEGDEVLLLLRSELQLENDVEELHSVFERQQSAIVQIRRTVFDASKCKGLDRAIPWLVPEKALDMQVVHLVVEIEWRCVTTGTLALSEENFFAANFAFRRFRPVETAGCCVEFWCGWEVKHILHLRHVADLDAIENHHSLLHCVNGIAIEVGGALLELGEILD